MKKILHSLILSSLLGALSGCASDRPPTTSTTTTTTEETTLHPATQ